MKLAKRTKLASYMAVWAMLGVILISVPSLVSPFAERSLTPTSSTNVDSVTGKTNNTTSYPSVTIGGSNGSAKAEFFTVSKNSTLFIWSTSPTNITIVTYTGNTQGFTITSTAPANVTVTTKSPGTSSATTAPISSNIPDFALRLTLILASAVVLSSLGLVRVRRRFRTGLEPESDLA